MRAELKLLFKKDLSPWFLAARPKTLAAAFAPILVGTALSAQALKTRHQNFTIKYGLLCLVVAFLIQIATNLINDAIDFKKGADNETRIGPKRVTQSGLIKAKTILIGGFFCLLLVSIIGIPIVLHAGFPAFILGVLSIFCAYIYTGGPYPLAYIGLGDLFVILFFGLAAVSGVYFVYLGTISIMAIVASLQIGFLSTVLIAINNFRDHINDAKVGKKTLAARFGKSFARIEIFILFFVSYLLNIYWITHGFYLAGVLPFITLPLAIKIIINIFQLNPSPIFNKFLAMSSGVLLLFSISLTIGIILK